VQIDKFATPVDTFKTYRISNKMPSMIFTGWALLVGSWAWLTVSTYTMILSKLLPLPKHHVLVAIALDRHYCLVPSASIVVLIFFAVLNWLGLKYFRHN
jgi:hypothetical protein